MGYSCCGNDGKPLVQRDFASSFTFTFAPGAFFVLALLSALQNHFKAPSATNTGNTSEIACGGNCAACFGEAKLENHITIDKDLEKKELEAKKKKEEALAKAKAAKENANAGEGK